ncbi:MAG: ISL3 family transposase [Pirellulaceae bacterium]|nr:ISL3 family transposase [Pirellulaceae bacterium]
MSQQALYQVLGIYGYGVTQIERDEKRLLLRCRPQPHRVCCPQCGSRDVILRGEKERWIRNLPIGGDCTWIIAALPRVECRACRIVRQVNIGLADARRTYSHAFERYVLGLCRRMTIQDVAEHLGVSWDIVKDIQKRHLQKHYAKPPLQHVRHIGIDEICVGRGYRFLTLVLDLDSGAILFAGEGKKAAALQPFWRRLKAAKARVRAVAIDMSPAYQQAVEENLPDAAIVFDRFHIIKLYSQKLTQLRRDLHRQATDDLKKKVLKGTRWLLLKNSENLDPRKGEPKRLQEALRLNESLATAYYLKEDLGQIWEQLGKFPAKMKLLDWYHQAMESGVRILQDFARTLLAHTHGILAWYDYPISNGPLEGTNNKIKTMNRQHYGLRDKEFFKLKLYQLHETKYALVG